MVLLLVLVLLVFVPRSVRAGLRWPVEVVAACLLLVGFSATPSVASSQMREQACVTSADAYVYDWRDLEAPAIAIRSAENVNLSEQTAILLECSHLRSATLVYDAPVLLRDSRIVMATKPGAGAACRTNSFTPETRVLMADGTTSAIEDIRVGDRVVAFDPETGERGIRTVTDTIVGNGVKHLVGVRVRTLSGESTIWATEHHPFWNPASGVWVDAGDLQVGSILLTSDGDRATVIGIDEVTRVQRVHNLTVEGIHTYYVIAAGEAVLVHNCLEGSDLDVLIKRGGKTTTDFDEVASHLNEHSKISREVASKRLHAIKAGVENNRDVVFTKSGGVYDATSGDYLGSLTSG